MSMVGVRTGEVVETDFIRVTFQRGLPQYAGINGCRVDDVIDVALDKLRDYQSGPLACAENEEAIRHLVAAKAMLLERVRRREEQGVLHTMSQHIVVRTEDRLDDFSATGA